MLEAQPQHLPLERFQTLPRTPDIFRRDLSIPQRISYFSSEVNDIAIIPVRAELHNNHLAEYLSIINRQQTQPDGRKVGLVFFVNDHAGDKKNKNLLRENDKTTRYLSYLARKEIPPEDFEVSQQYRELAEKIAENDNIEIRVDFAHSLLASSHYGKMDLHLMQLAGALKNPLTPDNETVLHIHNVDMRFRRNHMQTLRNAYDSNPILNFNISEFDLAPGLHENATDEEDDISRELLLDLDAYRLYQYAKITKFSILGLAYSGAPTISGRFTYFYNYGQPHPTITIALEEAVTNQDYILAYMGRRRTRQHRNSDGFTGEVFYLHRARTSNIPKDRLLSASDGDEIYTVVTQKVFKQEGFKREYDLLVESDNFIADLEEQTGVVTNEIAFLNGHRPNFLTGDRYQKILKEELGTEMQKVLRRQSWLHSFIEFQSTGAELHPDVAAIIDPFIQSFPDEVALIQKQISQGKPLKDIAEIIMESYDYFFNPNAAIHLQIARLRALKKYVLTQGISMIEQTREPWIKGS